MKASSRSRLATAYHEAGHAVACWHFGIRIKRVTIVPTDERSGACSHEQYLRGSDFYCDSDRARLRMERLIIVCFAGIEAQRRWRPRSVRNYHAHSDYQQAADLALRINGDGETATAYLKWLQLRTVGLLDVHWQVVTDLAADLMQKHTIVIRRPSINDHPTLRFWTT